MSHLMEHLPGGVGLSDRVSHAAGWRGVAGSIGVDGRAADLAARWDGGPGGLAAPGADSGLDLAAAAGALRRRKGLVLWVVVVGTMASALAALVIGPRYTATAGVLIEPGESQVVELRSVVQSLPGWGRGEDAGLATQIELLRSRSHARWVVEELGLADDPEFGPDVPRLQRLAQDWLPENWLATAGLADTGAASIQSAPIRLQPDPETAVDRLIDQLGVAREGQSHVVAVSYTASDPERAARIANGVVDLYIDGQLAAKVEATDRANLWIDARLDEMRGEVLAAEGAVEEYRATNDLTSVQGGSLDAQQLASLNAALLDARAEGMAIASRLEQARRLQTAGEGFRSLTEVASSPIIVELRQQEAALKREVAQLSREYGQQHPLMVQLLAEQADLTTRIDIEMNIVLRTLEQEVAIARSREQAVEASLREAKEQSSWAGLATVQLRELERAAAAKRTAYEALLARSKEIGEQRNLLVPDARLISAAAVPRDHSPSLATMTAIGFVASLLLAVALVALREHLDRGLRAGRQVEQAVGVPALGLVPSLPRFQRRPPYQYLLDRPLSAYAEAVKAIHTALQLTRINAPAQVVLITSSLPGEGKTSLAMSLAASVARSGRPTLVIDLDIRHPSVARQMSRPVDVDLVDLLHDRCTLKGVVLIDQKEPRLHAIPTMKRTEPSHEPLKFDKLQSTIAKLSHSYELIILDSGPSVISDTRIAALLADAVIFVVQWDKTTEGKALAGIEAIRGTRATIAGVALTRVDLRRHGRYGYGDVGQYYGKYANSFIN